MSAISNVTVVGLIIASCCLTAFGQTNLAPNPGFELPNVSGYLIQAKAGLDEDNPHTGRYSVRQEAVPGHQWNCVQMANASIPVHPGKIYRLTVFSRNNLDGGQASFGWREISKAGDTVCFQWQSVPNGQAGWQEHTVLIRPVKETTSLTLYFRIAAESTGGSVWWDDVCLVEMPETVGVKASAPWNVEPVDTLVLTREKDHTSPESVSVRMEVGRDGHCGTLKASLQLAGAAVQPGTKALWSREQRLDILGLNEVYVPTGDLPEGRYELCLTFVSLDQCIRMDFIKPLAVIVPTPRPILEPVRRTEIGKNGDFLVNGKPFLSIAYAMTPLDRVVMKTLREDYGATTTFAVGTMDDICNQIDVQWQAGLNSWGVLFDPAFYDATSKKWKDGPLTEVVNRLKTHPGLIGWDLFDEPDSPIHHVPPAEVRRAYDLIRRLDPNHVIWVTFCKQDKFSEYVGTSDFASYDHYPFPERGLGRIREYTRAIQAAFPKKPLLSYLQAFGYPLEGCGLPTPAQLRAQVYLNVCEGSTLFYYFTWSIPPADSLATSPELRSYTRLLNQELQELSPFLFSDKRIPSMVKGEGSEKLVWVAKQVGETIELIVVNPEPKPVSQWSIGLVNQKIESADSRFSANFPVTVSEGCLIDSLPAYGVGIYRLRLLTKEQAGGIGDENNSNSDK